MTRYETLSDFAGDHITKSSMNTSFKCKTGLNFKEIPVQHSHHICKPFVLLSLLKRFRAQELSPASRKFDKQPFNKTLLPSSLATVNDPYVYVSFHIKAILTRTEPIQNKTEFVKAHVIFWCQIPTIIYHIPQVDKFNLSDFAVTNILQCKQNSNPLDLYCGDRNPRSVHLFRTWSITACGVMS